MGEVAFLNRPSALNGLSNVLLHPGAVGGQLALVADFLRLDAGDENFDLAAPGCRGRAEAVGDGSGEDYGVAGGGEDFR